MRLEKMPQERAKPEGLRGNAKRLEEKLLRLRSKHDALASVLNRKLRSEKPETIGLYLKVLTRYREKYGMEAEKLRKDLDAPTHRGMYYNVAVEELS